MIPVSAVSCPVHPDWHLRIYTTSMYTGDPCTCWCNYWTPEPVPKTAQDQPKQLPYYRRFERKSHA